MAKKRRDELSWMNAVFCLMVIFIHLLSGPVTALRPESWQHQLSCVVQRLSFAAVYGFFLLSGVKLFLSPEMRGKGKVDWKKYYLKRVKSIILPYLIAETVYYVYIRSSEWYRFDIRELLGWFLSGEVYSHFYYVVALVQFILLTPLWRRWVRKYSPAWMIPISIGISWGLGMNLYHVLPKLGMEFPWQDRTFVQYLCFYLTGCYIGANYDAFRQRVKEYRGLVIGCFIGFTAADVIYSWWFYAGDPVPLMEFVHQMYLFSAIFLGFLIAPKLGRLPWLFRQLDQVSYLVFLYHLLGFMVFDRLFGGRPVRAIPNMAAKGLFVLCTVVPLSMLWRFGAVHIKQYFTEMRNQHGK